MAIFIGVLLNVPGNMAGSSVDLSTIMLEMSKHKSEKENKNINMN